MTNENDRAANVPAQPSTLAAIRDAAWKAYKALINEPDVVKGAMKATGYLNSLFADELEASLSLAGLPLRCDVALEACAEYADGTLCLKHVTFKVGDPDDWGEQDWRVGKFSAAQATGGEADE